MSCYSTIVAYRLLDKVSETSGKNIITFQESEIKGSPHERLVIPCGQCIGCRIDRAKAWAVRVYHEALGHKDSSFVTLTYNDGDLKDRKSLDKREFVLFMKRLRKKYGKVRFLHCGEYGEVCQQCGLSRRKCRELREHPFRELNRSAASPRMFIWN